MKVSKSQVLLYIHEKLLLEKEFDPSEIKRKFELENKTFYRYIQEIRAYYSNVFKKESICYSKKMKKYYLVVKTEV